MTKDEALKLALDELVWANRYCDIQTGVIEDVKEALAQPEQKPVAYLVIGPYEKQAFSNIDSANSYCNGLNKGFGEAAYAVSPLYTAPPKRPWVGLTDAEIKTILGPWGSMPVTGYTRQLFDKIEAKLKEKNFD